MKKFKGILTGTLLIMTLGMLTACGNNNNEAEETGTVTEENVLSEKEPLTYAEYQRRVKMYT